jgi:hypothetical protein
MSTLYLISYKSDQNFNDVIFHGYIDSLYKKRTITDWWHYTDHTYMVVSNLDANGIYNAVFPGVPRRNLLIIAVNPNITQGWLPKTAWDWINKYKK